MQNLLRTARSFLRGKSSADGIEGPASHDGPFLLQAAYRVHQAGRLDEALALYQTAIKADPLSHVAHNLIGTVLCGLGRKAQAEVHFEKAIDLDPAYPDALNNLANCRREQGDVQAAERLYKRSLELRADSPLGWCNLGLLYLNTARLEEAASCFRRALTLDATNVTARSNLGVVLRKQGLMREAEVEFRAAVEASPMHAAAWSGLADILQMRGLLDEAEKCCRAALELSSGDLNAINNLATIARSRRQFDIARAHCDDVLRRDPQHLGALNNLGNIAVAEADYATAESIYRSALRLNPEHAVTRFNLAMALLTLGQYEEGFRLYESRFEAFPARYLHSSPMGKTVHSLPVWSGEHRPSARLLLWGEQGLGDFVMMLRYVPDAAKRVGAVTVFCDPALRRLVELTPSIERVITSAEEAAGCEFDLQCSVMSLPFAFATRLDTIPAKVPYVSVPSEASARFRDRLAGVRPRVGIAWAGSRTLEEDDRRSIAFEHLAPLLELDHVEWVSLQKGDASRDWSAVRGSAADCIEICGDLLDTAGLIMHLDLVISVDTVVAHLAGALGRSVWLLNRYPSEWRWSTEGSTSAWYGGMRIFRQSAPSRWEDVIQSVRTALIHELR